MATVQPGGAAPGVALSKLIVSAKHVDAGRNAAITTTIDIVMGNFIAAIMLDES
jgi:hypothetical protein